MGKKQDLIGKRFSRLLVVEEANSRRTSGGMPKRYWKCRCDCGNESEVNTGDLNSGHIKSCGCLLQEAITKHGMVGTGTYSTWQNMKMRCKTDNSHPSQKHYGMRGIKVCDRWLNSFNNFYEDMGERPEGMSIDRIDVNGDYEPSNCRWVTWDIQKYNKRNTIYLTYKGETKTLPEWAEILGRSQASISARYYKGESFEDIVEENFGEILNCENFENVRTISVDSYVFSICRNGEIDIQSPYKMKWEKKRGGFCIRVYNGTQRLNSFSPAKLICAAFIDKKILTDNKFCVYFKDGNQKNLSVGNLSIITRGYQLHLRHKGEGV